MANEWLRLWHDMPNDPKFKTVARLSKQPISLVLSTYLHMMVDASRNVTRGHVDVTVEDLASALDVTEDQISAIFDAMEGRLKDGNQLSGWDKRQPKKEDKGSAATGAKSATERKREQRERDNLPDVTKCHDESRNVTLDKDKDKDKEEIKRKSKTTTPPDGELFPGIDPQVVADFVGLRKSKRAPITKTALDGIAAEAAKAGLSLEDALRVCCSRGWQGFEASWLLPKSNGARASPASNSGLGVHGQATANAAKQWLESKNAG